MFSLNEKQRTKKHEGRKKTKSKKDEGRKKTKSKKRKQKGKTESVGPMEHEHFRLVKSRGKN